MTVMLELSNPPQWTPGKFSNHIMLRVWFGWFAVVWLRVPFNEFATTGYDWTFKD